MRHDDDWVNPSAKIIAPAAGLGKDCFVAKPPRNNSQPHETILGVGRKHSETVAP